MVVRFYGETDGARDELGEGADHRGTRYLMKRRQASVPPGLARGMEVLRTRLANLVRSERIERHETPPLITTLRHLVSRRAGPAYRAVVEQGIPGLEGVTLRVSGPSPAYAFTPEEIS